MFVEFYIESRILFVLNQGLVLSTPHSLTD